MAREINKLSARKVQTIGPGRHSDGGGLYLLVEKSGTRRWAFIYRRKHDGKQSEMGLGSFHSVPLARARELAAEARRQIAVGIDPLQARAAARSETDVPTFGELAETVIASLESGWRNDKHRMQWRNTLILLSHGESPRRRGGGCDSAHGLDLLSKTWSGHGSRYQRRARRSLCRVHC